ncbi:MAG: bile acid:sodium symporter family protein [Bacillota bacterium]
MKTLERSVKFIGDYFIVWTIVAAVIGFFQPATFAWVLPQVTILLGIIMFGMGMTLEVDDFKNILTHPKYILLGSLAQFTLMPLIAFGLAVIFQLPPELAVGVILVGTCPGGTASNVMTYLAKGDVALSVSITTLSTFLAPILTPLLTVWLAGKWIPVSAGAMFISIVKIVLIPIILGLVINSLFGSKLKAVIKSLPAVSVIAIVLIVGGVVGANSGKIATTGAAIFLIVILHNVLGLLSGYFLGDRLSLEEAKKRALSIEIGMQNSGLAVSLAVAHFSPAAAIPAAIFSVWHNISGPLVATYWSRKTDSLEETNPNLEEKVS